jgi:hypothetical protein
VSGAAISTSVQINDGQVGLLHDPVMVERTDEQDEEVAA